MKKIIEFVLLGTMACGLFGYDVFSASKKNGNVRSAVCTEYAISTKFGDYFRTPQGKMIFKYDEKGNEIEYIEFIGKDTLKEKKETSYNSDGTVKEVLGYTSDGDLSWKAVNSYKDKKLVDVSEYGTDNVLNEKTIMKYKGDFLVDESSYNGDGKLLVKNIYTADDNGRLVKWAQYFADGSLDCQEEYTWNEKGEVESILSYDSTGREEKEVFRYGSNGLLNEITTYDSNNKITQRTIIKYNTEGNVGKISVYEIAEKFGTTVNDLIYMAEYSYEY